MSTRWAKCSAPDSVGRQANSLAALPHFSVPRSVCTATPLVARRLPHSALSHARGKPPCARFETAQLRQPCAPSDPDRATPPLFFKAKPATARALLFSCPSLRVCSDAPGQFVAQSAQYSLFSRLPTCVVRLPAVQRDVSQKSRVIIPKNVEQSGKTRRLFPDYSAVSRLFLRRRAAYPRCILNLCEEGKHRVPILCINFAAFSLFPSAGKLSGSTFRLHPYSFHRPFYNKTHSPRSLS